MTERPLKYQRALADWREMVSGGPTPEGKLYLYTRAIYDLAGHHFEKGMAKPDIVDDLKITGFVLKLGDDARGFLPKHDKPSSDGLG